MTLKEILAEFESLGTAQNRKVYARHSPNYPRRVFGVSFANIGALRRKIRRDHALALQLWDEGSFESRVLACMVADPAQGDAGLLDRWAGEVQDQGVADAFADYAAQTADGVRQARRWIRSKGEYLQCCGWNTLGVAMKLGVDGLSSRDCEALLARIEKSIHTAPNRAREAMNWAVIAIGSRKPEAREQALAAARRIGAVQIDHGETGCRTPDAESYIGKVVANQAQRAAKGQGRSGGGAGAAPVI